ncbi:MAG: aminoacyl-tRNA deacylase [Acidimicrobiaceae bacterium]|nr:aminoacyl-tRNA deacylase [Acidimicrobiaceae bacterium]
MMAKEGGAERFLRAAAELGIDVEPVTYPDGTRTAADAAAAISCELSQIAKSLLVMTDTGPVLALTAGHNRLDLDTLSGRLERSVRMANADEARRVTGYAIGGTPPFGHPEPIETLIDPALLEHDIVYGAAGTPDRCFPIGSARLQAVTGAAPADFVVGHRAGPSSAE